ncbi:VOC family protein [Staphylococcus canis]|uniref:VOC family protein n=1 Tax=Staphylococcus canis TaxID=2724942 RepID=A0ABS0T7A7_9STAP|nr:VOC family protein [Staphylococcus canis]MBI5974636.1 VOC family protein [Staphylococcus canis]
MIEIQFDHIIHYIDNLKRFEFPGQYLKIHNGGRHEKLGTYNRLIHIDLSYIELLDRFDHGRVKQQSKTNEGKQSFASSILENDAKQGFKKICLRTNNIEGLQQELEMKGIKTIGPIDMTRQNKKGHTLSWQLLYIDTTLCSALSPFFIQWQQSDEARRSELQTHFQSHLKIDTVGFRTYQRQMMVDNWQQWLGMEVVESSDKVTVLQHPNTPVKFKITEGKEDMIESIRLIDETITAPVQIRIKGATYQFVPPNDTTLNKPHELA